MKYGLLERANLLWKTLEQKFGSNNDKRSSSTGIPENISSSSIHIDQDQEEQSSDQKEKVKSTSLRRPDGPILTEQKISWLKRKIVPHQDPKMMMMTLMMNMMIKNSC
jgi:hypothetical protein